MSVEEMLREARESNEYWTELAILDFTEELCRLMDEQDVSRAELARLVDREPSWITRILRGETNFQIATMVRLARALGTMVHIHLAPQGARVSWIDNAHEADVVTDIWAFPRASRRVEIEPALSGSASTYDSSVEAIFARA